MTAINSTRTVVFSSARPCLTALNVPTFGILPYQAGSSILRGTEVWPLRKHQAHGALLVGKLCTITIDPRFTPNGILQTSARKTRRTYHIIRVTKNITQRVRLVDILEDKGDSIFDIDPIDHGPLVVVRGVAQLAMCRPPRFVLSDHPTSCCVYFHSQPTAQTTPPSC